MGPSQPADHQAEGSRLMKRRRQAIVADTVDQGDAQRRYLDLPRNEVLIITPRRLRAIRGCPLDHHVVYVTNMATWSTKAKAELAQSLRAAWR